MPAESITVLITAYCEGELLRRAFASLEAQTDRDFDIVIVNDASPDPLTNDLCRQLECAPRTRVIWRSQNGGLSAARNTGYENLPGQICVPLDADDELPAAAVADIRAAFQRAPDADFVFGNYLRHEIESGARQVVSCERLCGADGYLDPSRITDDWILLGTSPCRQSAWAKIGGYNLRCSHDAQDVDFWLRLLTAGGRGYYVNRTIYHWHRSATGMNSRQPGDAFLRVLLANLAFADKFWDGRATRRSLMWSAMRRGDFDTARQLARQLRARRDCHPTVQLVAALPTRWSRALYRWKQG